MRDRKLGFIVEGDVDKIIIEALAHRLLPTPVHFHIVRLGGKAAFATAYTTVFTFLDNDYEHVIILFDTGSINEAEIAEKQFRLEEILREHQLDRQVTVCPVVPQIEVWLLANYLEHPETFRDPNAKLAEAIGVKELTPGHLKRIAETVDLSLIKRRNTSFAQFVKALQAIMANQLELPV